MSGWRNGLVVKSRYSFGRRFKFSSQGPCQVAYSQRIQCLSPPQALHSHAETDRHRHIYVCVCVYTYIHIHTHNFQNGGQARGTHL